MDVERKSKGRSNFIFLFITAVWVLIKQCRGRLGGNGALLSPGVPMSTIATVAVIALSSSLQLHFRPFVLLPTSLQHPPLIDKPFSPKARRVSTPESGIVNSKQSRLPLDVSKRDFRSHGTDFTKNYQKDNEEVDTTKTELYSESKSRDLKSFHGKFSKHTEILPPQRLSKVLATVGVASRRSCEELIFNGNVTVNGPICKIPQTRVDITKDVIFVNGKCVSKNLPHKLYFALNKPKGYICSCVDEDGKSVIRLFDKYFNNTDSRYKGLPKPRLFTVGRLDVATSGLIVVTNDGEFAQRIAHPSSGITKEYIASIHGSVRKCHLINMIGGAVIDGVHCAPDSVELLPKQPELLRPRIRIVVHDGRKHEVRELVKNAGLEISTLRRVRIGSFRLPRNLRIGCFIKLKKKDLEALTTMPCDPTQSESEH